MDSEKSVLVYHVYVVNNWKSITQKLLHNVPHDDIYVNVNIDWYTAWKLPFALNWLKKRDKVKKVFITLNAKERAEVAGFEKLRAATKEGKYAILTYMHGKGVTKPKNRNIQDWVELMRYFLIDRMDLCKKAFEQGYKLYGVNLGVYDPANEVYGPYQFSKFHYSGNFVSINLKALKEEFYATPIDIDYFGIEGFWGKLCAVEYAYCAHTSNIDNHYKQLYPTKLYR